MLYIQYRCVYVFQYLLDECAKMWRDKTEDLKKDHHKLIKIYALGPFLFGHVDQPEHWIRFLTEVGLLPSRIDWRVSCTLA